MPCCSLPYNSVAERRCRQSSRTDAELLERCRQAWNNLEDVRRVRERTKSYCYGDQWGDTIRVYEKGMWREMTEREYMRQHGTTPMTNNVMVSLLNSISGLYSRQGTEPVCFARTHSGQGLSDMMSATLQCNWQNTQMEDLLNHAFEDYVLGGVLIARETFEDRDQEIPDAWTDIIEPNYAFWEGGSDPRHLDLSLIGVLHDVSREDLYKRFARPEYGLTIEDLNELYGIDTRVNNDAGIQQNDVHTIDNVTFDYPSKPGHYVRVIEVWTTETKYRYQCYDPIATNGSDAYFRVDVDDEMMLASLMAKNVERQSQYDEMGVAEDERAYITWKLIADKYWYYTYMAPDGTVLCQGETPYEHKSHPFTIKLYPFVNGEVHPFLSNIIDQQRYINRLIIMNDMAIRSSAKGIMMVPKQVIPDNMTPDQFAEQLTEYEGLVFYEPKKSLPNARPDIITSNAVNLGTNELLSIELSLIRDISSVQGALQGKAPSSGTSASRYSMETQNATTALFVLLKDMEVFSENVAQKKCMTINQFYEDGRMIYNKDFTSQMTYDRAAVRDVKFKISVKNAAATASYQTQVNDQLQQLLQMGAINVIQYLQNCNEPFSDKLLQSIQKEQEEQRQAAQQAQQMQLAAQQLPQVAEGMAETQQEEVEPQQGEQ